MVLLSSLDICSPLVQVTVPLGRERWAGADSAGLGCAGTKGALGRRGQRNAAAGRKRELAAERELAAQWPKGSDQRLVCCWLADTMASVGAMEGKGEEGKLGRPATGGKGAMASIGSKGGSEGRKEEWELGRPAIEGKGAMA